MHIDDIDSQWSEKVYVWVRPASGDWDAITKAIGHQDRGKTDWRPAMITGFSDDKWAYNTINDSRQMRIIGSTYAYPHALFELGGYLEQDQDNVPLPVSTPQPRATS
jgi:hypothetical protein